MKSKRRYENVFSRCFSVRFTITQRIAHLKYFALFLSLLLVYNDLCIAKDYNLLHASYIEAIIRDEKAKTDQIDVKVDNVTLRSLLPILERKGKVRFMYSEDNKNFDKLISIQVKDMSILQVLNILFVDTDLEYKTLDGGLIVIKSKNRQQDIPVKGLVKDQNGQVLAGVSVLVKGTAKGTSTNESGNFTLNAPENAVLIFSFLGYIAKEVPANTNQPIQIVLEEESASLGEVVVTALGISREKKSLSYAVTQIDGEQVTKAREINLGNALTGRVAGVNATGTSTGPGGSSRIVIRGNGSLNGENQPLIVVNGIPIDNSNLGSAGSYGGMDRGNGLSSINPDDIESISVLKGGTAAALYGSRAANGVILITTKSGKGQEGLGLEYNTTFTLEAPRNLLDWQYEYGAGSGGLKPASQAEAIANGRMSWGAKLDGSQVIQPDGQERPYTAQRNNIKNFYNTGTTFSNTLAFSGANEWGNFRLSASDINNKGIVPNNGLNIKSFNLNVNATLAEKIILEGRAQYSIEKNDNRPFTADFQKNPNAGTQIIANSIDVRTLAPGYDANGYEMVWSDYVYATNPYFAINKMRNGDTRNRFIGMLSTRYNITDYLYVRGRLGIDQYNFDAFDLSEPSGTAFNNRGQMNTDQNFKQEVNAEAILGYEKSVGDFSINALVGGNQMRNTSKGIRLVSGQFNVPFQYFIGNGSAQNFTLNYAKFGINSLFASADIGFRSYLYLTLTARKDWFSTLASDQNSLLYPSVGLSYLASEAWKAMPDWLSYLKFRASWAQVGGGAPAPYGLDLTYMNAPQQYVTGATLMTINSTTIPNRLKPYTSTTSEAGIETRVFDNKLGLDLTVYDRTTTNDIVNASVPYSSGYQSVALNVGKIRNRGVEVLFTGAPMTGKSLRWDITYNVAYNRNTVLKISEDLGSIQLPGATTRTLNGGVYHFEGQPFGMLAGNRAARNADGLIIYNSATGIPLQGPLEVLGRGVPPLTMGITNTFTWRNFNLNVLIDGKFGAKVYSATTAYGTQYGLDKRTVANNVRETGVAVSGVDQQGNPYNASVNAQTYYSTIWSMLTDEFVTSADFIKLRSITLGYSLPAKVLNKTPFKTASFSFVARNLLFIYKKADNIDPEASYNSGNAQGLENFGLPTVRNYGLNLSVKF
ncbi:SusC/RagA family TonB-linked outer membrane protein [Olivibacter sp. CPCC 100613]|uniref:SusC/RagA family TonB-linked outer membrane protein n=1 Tax=Olivibacter sp. CPCC 100613 TaxID=3079931 RepID=UPI002FF5DD4E